MSQLFNKFLGAETKISKNGFDLSHREVFSTKVGILNAPFFQETLYGGHYQIDVTQITRTQPLQTAAFTRFGQHYEFFFVPYNDLFHSFNQIIAQREDKQSTTQPGLQMPYFNLVEFLKKLLPYAAVDYLLSLATRLDYTGSRRLPARSAYFEFSLTGLSGSNYVVRYSGNFTDNGRPRPSIPNYFLTESMALDVIRNLDMMGYGNYLPLVKLLVSSFLNTTFLNDSSDSVIYTLTINSLHTFFSRVVNGYYESVVGNISFTDAFGAPSTFSTVYLYKAAITDVINYFKELSNFGSDPVHCNLWRPLAYNKIYEQIYRNSYYDFRMPCIDYVNTSTISFEYVNLFNLDDIVGEISFNELNFYRVLCIFASKYHQYDKDMFSGVLPSTQFGDVSVMTDDRSWLNLSINDGNVESNVSTFTGQGSVRGLGYSSSVAPTDLPKFRFDPALAISVLTQRRANALQRFRENMLRAGNRTKDAFRAHFGGNGPKSEAKNNVYYLGSFDGNIDLNTVASTSETSDIELGQLASNGVGMVQGNKIKFDADDFGVIVGVMYIAKPAEYEAFGLDKVNQNLDPFDYPYGELQNIGLAPLESSRLDLFRRSDEFSRVEDEQSSQAQFIMPLGIMGYLPQFIEHKTRVDKVHGEFYSAAPWLYFETSTGTPVRRLSDIPLGEFSSYVTPRGDSEWGQTYSWLLINPNSVDNVFKLQSDFLQSSDQFHINCQFSVFASQPLSVIGLPY